MSLKQVSSNPSSAIPPPQPGGVVEHSATVAKDAGELFGAYTLPETVPIPAGVLSFPEGEIRYHAGGTQRLSRQELALLSYMVPRANRSLSRAELLRQVWQCNPDVVSTRTVDMHVAMVRKKLRDKARDPEVIVTVSGHGYLFRYRPEPLHHQTQQTWPLAV